MSKYSPFRESFNPAWNRNGATVQHYGDREKPANGTIGQWMDVPICSFSDYSGSQLERANAKAFQDECPASLTGALHVQSGGHGTRALIIRTMVLRLAARDWTCAKGDVPDWLLTLKSDCESLAGIINGLEDYPVVNDENMSQMEEETAQENWADWEAKDTAKDVAKANPEIDWDRSDVDVGKLLTVLMENCNGRTEDEGSGIGNCSYRFDERSYKDLSDELLMSCGFHLVPDEAKALEMVEEALPCLGTNTDAALDLILATVEPRDLARAIADLPGLSRDAVLSLLAISA